MATIDNKTGKTSWANRGPDGGAGSSPSGATRFVPLVAAQFYVQGVAAIVTM